MSIFRLTQEYIDRITTNVIYQRIPGTTVTICCITLPNGFTVLGDASCVYPEDFDEVLGQEIALAKDKAKAWELEGYLLKERQSS